MTTQPPAGIGSTVVSPAPFPMTRVVSSALYFGMIYAWDYHQRKVMATPRSARPQLTGGNILSVSYNVLYRWEFSRRDRHSDITLRSVRCNSVKSRDVFISLQMRLGMVSQATTTARSYWQATVRENTLDMLV